MSLIVDEHRRYLADTVRIDCFRRALREVVRPGMVVADVGSGTGILGLLALEAGAARVHAIEATGMIEIARALAAANGFADRFHPHQRELQDASLPERVDVCVGDFIGRLGFDAGAFEIYPYCATHLLKPGGLLIPSSFTLHVAPVERADLAADAHFWDATRHGFLLAPVAEWAVNTGYPCRLVDADLLGAPGVIGELETRDLPPCGGVRCELAMRIGRAGTLHGLGAWCTARLTPEVEMTTSPLVPDRITRRNVFLPLARPVEVTPGDMARVRVAIQPAETLVTWSVEVCRADGTRQARQTQSTVRGMLLSQTLVRRLRPDARPGLSRRGSARLTTLQLCAEQAPLGEIERRVWDRHRDLFATAADAAGFVAEVVSRYAAD